MLNRSCLALITALVLLGPIGRPVAAQGCTLLDCPNQAPTVSVAISRSASTDSIVTLTVYASDAEGLAMGTLELWVNSVLQPGWYSSATVSNPGGTNLSVSASGPLGLAVGTSQIRARICDVANPSICGEQTIPITRASSPPPPPFGVPSVSLMQLTDARRIMPGGSTLGYATPSYISVDAPRSIALQYSSEVAEELAVVELDATVSATTTPRRIALQVFAAGTGTVLSSTYFLGEKGTMRLAARFPASCPGGATACAIKVDLKVSADYPRISQSDTTLAWMQSGVRLLLLKPPTHPYGRGWLLTGAQRLFVQTDGSIVLWDGGDGLSFFTKSACTGAGATERCDYDSPQGDFTVLARRVAHPLYGTRYFRAGRGGDTTFFNDAGLLVRTKARFQALSIQLAWVSDALGTRVTGVTDPMGRTITLQYEPAQGGSGGKPGSLRTILLPDGRPATVSVASATNNLVLIVGPDGRTDLAATYAPGTARLQSWNERIGGGNLAYDSRGLVTMVKGVAVAFEGSTAPGADSILVASALGAALARGKAVLGTEDQKPLLAASAADTTAGSDGSISKVWKHPSGRPTRTLSRGAAGDSSVTNVSYDAWFLPLVTETLGRAPVTFTYTGSSVRLLASVTDGGSGTTTSYAYGPFDQVKTVHVNGTKLSEAFFASALTLAPDSVKSDTANTVRFKYDSFGRVRSTRGASGVVDTSAVDATHGNTIWASSSGPGFAPRAMSFVLDASGRVSQVTDHLGRVSKSSYDLLNRVTTEVRLVGSAQPDTVLRQFDDDSRTYRMRDPIGNWYTQVLNAAGLTISRTDPRNQVSTFGYDRRGALVRTTDRRGTIVRDSLDALGRLVKRKWGSDSILFAYDPGRRWVAVKNAESTDTAFVDAAGRPILAVTVRGSSRYTLAQGWIGTLPDGVAIQSFTAPNTAAAWIRSTGTGYDAQRRESVLQDFTGGATTTTFDSREMEKTVALPNYTMVRTNAIGSLGELQAQTFSGSAASLTRTYGYDTSTRIAQIERGSWSDNTKRIHNYDSRDRLMDYRDVRSWVETVWEPWDPYGDCPGCMIQNDITHVDTLRSGSYEYDRNGNPKGAGIVVDSVGNRLVSFGGESFTYDAEGNLLQRTGGASGSVTYNWNGLGQLTQVVSSQGTTSYGYDGWGRRVRKTVNGAETRFLLHEDQVVMEVNASNAVVAEYTYYPGTDRPHGMRRSGQQYYFAQDAQGNVHGVMNPNGSVAESYEYTPQGAPIGGASSVGNPYRWKGREWDAEAGLYYVRARYYDPGLRRFISEDPTGTAGGMNVFEFAAGDAINNADPDGLSCVRLSRSAVTVCPPVYVRPLRTPTWDPWLVDFGQPVSVINRLAEENGAIPVGDLSPASMFGAIGDALKSECAKRIANAALTIAADATFATGAKAGVSLIRTGNRVAGRGGAMLARRGGVAFPGRRRSQQLAGARGDILSGGLGRRQGIGLVGLATAGSLADNVVEDYSDGLLSTIADFVPIIASGKALIEAVSMCVTGEEMFWEHY